VAATPTCQAAAPPRAIAAPAVGALPFPLFDRMPIAVLQVRCWDGELGEIAAANAAACALLGRPADALVGCRLDSLLAISGTVTGDSPVQLCGLPGGRWLTASVSPLEPTGGNIPGDHAWVILQDVTEHRIAQERLDRAARQDSLTGLTNRAELLRRLAGIDADTEGPYVAVIFVDLDGFKRINDTQGHQVGDEVLVAVARRIRSVVRPEDTLARIGGDEFVVLCPRLADPLDARAVADRVRATLDGPISVSSGSLRLGMSVGIASARADALAQADLMRRADMAMYRAKAAGGNRVHHLPGGEQGRTADAERIREALDVVLGRASAPRAADDTGTPGSGRVHPPADPRCQPGSPAHAGPGSGRQPAIPGISLAWHPVAELATGRIRYVECIVRLRDRAGALVPPWQFLPVAARAGLTLPLGAHALRLALRGRAAWPRAWRDLPVGLDVIGELVATPRFASVAERVVAEEGQPTSNVVLEVAESGLAVGGRTAERTLRALGAAGFRLALDRFGSGGASLAALRGLGSQRVKLDWRVVAGLADGGGDRELLVATLAAAHALGQRVVAEGVQTAEQLHVLAALGCDEVQGEFVTVRALRRDVALGWPRTVGSRATTNGGGRGTPAEGVPADGVSAVGGPAIRVPG
jgi:diguanylate cyclase (GGDEF)-like protein